MKGEKFHYASKKKEGDRPDWWSVESCDGSSGVPNAQEPHIWCAQKKWKNENEISNLKKEWSIQLSKFDFKILINIYTIYLRIKYIYIIYIC